MTVTTSNTATNACLTCTFVGKITLSNSIFAFLNNFVNFPIVLPFLMAGQEGLEPPAPGFGDQCSTN